MWLRNDRGRSKNFIELAIENTLWLTTLAGQSFNVTDRYVDGANRAGWERDRQDWLAKADYRIGMNEEGEGLIGAGGHRR